jgi:glycosyltransferase involved in cell wall biosynthesis
VFGRIDRHKGHADLFRALATVDGPWELDVVGGGPESLVAELRGIATGLGIGSRVHWHGQVDSDVLVAMLSRSWLVCFPSHFEGFGLALVEAMACGCNLLVSDLPTHREILGDGLSDRIVDFTDPTAPDRVRDALRRPATAMRSDEERVRSRAERFSIGRLVDQLEGLYSDLGLSAGSAVNAGNSPRFERKLD